MIETASSFNIGRAIARTFSASRSVLPQILILLVVTTALHFGIGQYGSPLIQGILISSTDYFVPVWSFAYNLLVTTIGAGATVMLIDRVLSGQTPRLGPAFVVGLQSVIPLAALRFATWVPIIIGLVLLIAPGLWLAVRWSVAAPARVLEGGGLTNALRRSTQLTKGHRWKLLGLYTLWFGSLAILSAAASWARVFNMNGGFTVSAVNVSVLATGSLLPQVSNVLTAALATVVFHQLRHEKDGPLSATVAEVFA